MTQSVYIRPARVDDAAAIARVHVDSWCTTYVGIVPDEHLASLSYESREQRWRERLIAPDVGMFVFVAETEGAQIVGFAVGGPERENDAVYKGELYGLYLLQEYQRRGIGRQLVATIVQRLHQDGFANMLIWVLAENPACAFYAVLGGKPTREKMVTIGGKELREIGYGWDRLDAVTR
jgi:GNAT superfamily N-acetyltransferase